MKDQGLPVVLQLLFKLLHAAELLLLLSHSHFQPHYLGLLIQQLRICITGTLQPHKASVTLACYSQYTKTLLRSACYECCLHAVRYH